MSELPEWLTAVATEESLPAHVLLLRLLAALAFGGAVAVVYRMSHGRESRDATAITTTLVLLSALIAMVTIVIGSNVARAFSLVGALSIVRFRTIVEDTRDTAFVIFSVIVGMATGCGLLLVPTIGIPLVGLAAWGMGGGLRAEGNSRSAATLTVRVGLGHDPDHLLRVVLERYFSAHRLIETSTARQGSMLEVTYRVRLRSPAGSTPLIAELNGIAGVHGAELRLS